MVEASINTGVIRYSVVPQGALEVNARLIVELPLVEAKGAVMMCVIGYSSGFEALDGEDWTMVFVGVEREIDIQLPRTGRTSAGGRRANRE